MTLGPVTLRLATRLYFTARVLSLFASFPFAALAISQGPPTSPEGSGLEQDVQYAFLAVGVLSTFIAWKFTLPGGALLILSGAVLGAYAAGRYTPETSLIVSLPFLAPGACYLTSWSMLRHRVFQVACLAFVAGVFWLGATESYARHASAFGPAHPSSMLAKQPIDRIEWAWSGGVTGSSATIKAKLAKGSKSARLLISPREDLQEPSFSKVDTADDAENRIATLAVNGLKSDTQYFFGIEVDGSLDQGVRGSFRTFPEGPSSFTIAVAACARTGSNGAVFDAIREQDPLLYIIAGDFHYQNIISNSRSAFRSAYDKVLSAPAQAALYRQTPIAYIWDDHDFGGNNSNAHSAAKKAALASYRENVPHYELSTGGGAIYQSFSAGRVAFVLTDTRSERDAEAGPGGKGDSVLGSHQRQWLKTQLLEKSRNYALVVWVNAVPWIAPEGNRDDWGGFADERREIANFIAENGIRNLLMVSGDAHMLAIDDGTNSDFSTSKIGGFPVLQAGALDRPGSVKGGPYSEGTYPGAGQYGLVRVDDDGESMTVSLTGRDWLGRELISYSFALPARPGH